MAPGKASEVATEEANARAVRDVEIQEIEAGLRASLARQARRESEIVSGRVLTRKELDVIEARRARIEALIADSMEDLK